jgi:class 3 adenylate cyclase/pimeloyl-ACP methyl ester carboxylesterase
VELPPPTTYIERRGKSFAYQAFGTGPALVILGEVPSHPDLMWTDPVYAAWMARAAESCRILFFQQAGIGLSEAIDRVPTLEEQASDIAAVMDAEGVDNAVINTLGTSSMAATLFAAQQPDRVDALIMQVPVAQGWRSPGVGSAGGLTTEDAELLTALYDDMFEHWGEGHSFDVWDATLSPRNRRIAAMLERTAASPATAAAVYEAASRADVREVLALVRAPTHVLHHASCRVPERVSRMVADLIDGAVFHRFPASDPHMSIGESFKPVIDFIFDVVFGLPEGISHDRQMATILFTDVASSTELVARHGDRPWRQLLERHEREIQSHVTENGGRLVKMIGDGSMSVFPGPAAAIRAAESVCTDAKALNIEVRAGVHAGECDRRPGGDISGLAVHIAARVGSEAAPGEVWVTRMVRDLVGGSGLMLTPQGFHELKGVGEALELFSVSGEDRAAAAVEQQPSPMRATDRALVATARRAPGLLRGLNRMDNARRRRFGRSD